MSTLSKPQSQMQVNSIMVFVKEKQQQQQQHPPYSQQQTSKHQFFHSMPKSVKVGGAGGGGTLQKAQTAQKLYAKAIYDNLADTPDELAFKKGDMLNIIEQDTDGLEGWWLCTLRGRQISSLKIDRCERRHFAKGNLRFGETLKRCICLSSDTGEKKLTGREAKLKGLCPGNRLRILNSYDSGCFSPSPTSSPSTSLAASTATLNSSICSTEIYENSSIVSGTGSGGSGSGSGCISGSQTHLNQQSHHNYNHNHHQQHHHFQQQQQQPQLNQSTLQQQQQQQRQGTRRSWHVSPNKVITPQRHGDVYIYYCPNTSALAQHSSLSQTPQHQHSHQQIYSNQSIYQNHSIMSSTSNSGNSNDFETYDTPKPATPVNYDCPKNIVCRTPTSATPQQLRFDTISLTMKGSGCPTPIQEESYDVPRPLNSLMHQQNTLTPSSSNSSLLTSDSLSLSFSSSNRSSLANMPDYDIPRRNPLPVRSVQQLAAVQQTHYHQHQHKQQQQFVNGNCMTYDFPLPSALSTPVQEKPLPNTLLMASTASTKELPLELSSALETLAKLQSEATAAITRLLSFVSPNWRLREKLEPVLMDVNLAAVRLRTALHDLTEFGEGALGNASRSEDRSLALKLRPLVRALRDADKLIHESAETLDVQGGWTLDSLTRCDDKSTCKPPDSLDQLIACAQTLTEDVRQTTSFIQGNASLLFKRQLPEVTAVATDETDGSNGASVSQENNSTGSRNTVSAEWLEDYDYVSFESKDAAAKKNHALREAIPSNHKKNFDTVIKAAETTASMAASNVVPVIANIRTNNDLTDKDKLLVRYYAVQISTHMGNLRQAIDSFLETVEKNHPPKFFIAYGKFVVVSAHNLVTIGDIVHRNVSKAELREKILRCTDALSDALKTCVMKSKRAAAHFPSVTAVQEMVDSVVDISHLASDLKTAMLHAVQLTI